MAGREVDRDLESQLRNYSGMIRQSGGLPKFKYRSLYELYFEEGAPFNSDPYTPEEEEAILAALRGSRRRWEIKKCFYNAQAIASEQPEFEYAEGYVLRRGLFPIQHGWAVFNGKPFDLTLRERGEPSTCDPVQLLDRASRNMAENAYWGIMIPVEEIRKTWVRTEQAMPIVEDPSRHRGYMEKGIPKQWKRPRLSGADGCTREMRLFGKDLREFLYDELRGWKALPAPYASWLSGGCWILARSLHEWIGPGSELWAVVANGLIQHVLVKVGACFLDGDGASTEKELLERWEKEERVPDPELRPFVMEDVWNIDCPAWAVRGLRNLLEQTFGSGSDLPGWAGIEA